MNDSTSNTRLTSVSEMYAHASTVQTPVAPPAISAAIMQLAAQTAAARSNAVSAGVAVAEPASVKPSLPTAEGWKEWLALMQQLIRAAATHLQNIFTIPTLRYGLPAMMVAAVGFKIALSEAPTMQESAHPAPAPAVAAPAAPTAEVTTSTPAKPANATASPVATNASIPSIDAAAKVAQTSPARQEEPAAKKRTVLANSFSKTVEPEATFKDNAHTAAKAPIELPRQPQGFPAERSHSSSTNELVKPDTAQSPVRTAPVKQILAEPAPLAAASAAPVPLVMPAAAPSMKKENRSSVEPSYITKEQRLRWLIATNREADGRVQEVCQTNVPKLELVQSWLSSGANPNYVLNGVSTLALAQRCGFAEAAQAMHQSAKP